MWGFPRFLLLFLLFFVHTLTLHTLNIKTQYTLLGDTQIAALAGRNTQIHAIALGVVKVPVLVIARPFGKKLDF